jgi:hypothetical protein
VGTKVLDPLRARVKVTDYYGPSFAGKLTHIKMIEMCVESDFATEHVRSAIAGHFLLFW